MKEATSEPIGRSASQINRSDRGPGRKRQDMRIDRSKDKKNAIERAANSSEGNNGGFTIGSASMLRIVPCRVIASRGNGGDTRWRRPRQAGSIEPPVVERGHHIHSVFMHSMRASHIYIYKYTRMYIVPARAHTPLMKSIRRCALCSRGCWRKISPPRYIPKDNYPPIWLIKRCRHFIERSRYS